MRGASHHATEELVRLSRPKSQGVSELRTEQQAWGQLLTNLPDLEHAPPHSESNWIPALAPDSAFPFLPGTELP